ncbi:pantoate-beta-alanine ligase [Yamadazyma tenuis]|uniref:Pantoate--beta-alanine ligase n=1 Tax=Candida tenuis (strain ATCC 10573 / BCRC 21748 / CBS 615 / JCM 9827 / NBRC 10315 / NRRL Y-1498 / VKM Y-70) TaxID=590646 RepID=G3BBR1_CANTC|nr:pantothenate synthase [Yamadazyma tenuis ATCC 10573]EGV62215.1 pantothenate synthase [Yamadazyma tenuis ATCC 10573]WEJ93474.1 pantoate-beta-alanine ligase [Yamadazyma tenuis]
MKSIQIFRTVAQVRQWRANALFAHQSVGLVPTMGALHDGHCSLISQSLQDNDKSIVSIFVNPSQFAPHEDLDAYPRTVDADMALLNQFPGKKVDAVFIPKVSEMYPSGISTNIDEQRGAFVAVKGCSEQLEGSSRPQFFRGVATVVTKLLNAVTPTRVYFGQKDAQQCVVVQNLVKDLLIETTVKVLPTKREANGLAMSSRNAYLSEETKQKSAVIYQSLVNGERFYQEKSQHGPVNVGEILARITDTLNDSTGFDIEYIALSHPETLEDLEVVEPGVGAVVSTAVRVPREGSSQQTRLIDNVILH